MHDGSFLSVNDSRSNGLIDNGILCFVKKSCFKQSAALNRNSTSSIKILRMRHLYCGSKVRRSLVMEWKKLAKNYKNWLN